jgi:hypothetical protein
MDPSAPGGPNNGHALTKGKALSNAMRFGKRSLAGVAAGALALGMLSIASAPAASAKPSIKPKGTATATVNAVRAIGTTSPISTPAASMTWGAGAGTLSTSATLDLISAPSATARMYLVPTGNVANANGIYATLNDDTPVASAVGVDGTWLLDSDDSVFTFRVDTAGSYTGALYNGTDTVAFSFATAGAPASMTLAPATQTVLVGATAELALTLLDSNGKPTQPQTVDSVRLTRSPTDDTLAGGGALTDGTYGLSSSLMSTGTGYFGLLTNPATAGATTITATPLGTLPPAVTAQTATVTKSGTVSANSVSNLTVSSPTNAFNGGTRATGTRTAQVPNPTTNVTVTVDDTATAAAGNTLRFAVSSQAGALINGVAAPSDDSLYIDVKTDASKKASLNLALAGTALNQNASITVRQVTVADVPTTVGGGAQIVINQVTPAVQDANVVPTPTSALVKVGDSTKVTVQVDDSFGVDQSNWTVRAFRSPTVGSRTGGTLLATTTTNASGSAQVTLSPLSTTVNNGQESYYYTATAPVGGANATSVLLTTITYTTSGNITSMSVQPLAGTTFSSTTPAITSAPVVYVPDDTAGVVYGASTGAVTLATGVDSVAPNGMFTSFVVTTSPQAATTVTVSQDSGLSLSTTSPTAATTLWNSGKQSVAVVGSGGATGTVYVWGTKTGTHDIVFTSSGIALTGKVKVSNRAQDAYNISVTPDKADVAKGGFTTLTAKVTDFWGNPVATTAGAITGTATGEVLLGGNTNTATFGTNAAGLANITVIAANVAGAGTVTLTPTTLGAPPAWAAGYNSTRPTSFTTAPVTSAASAITVGTGPVTKSITITGSRATVSGKPGIEVDGITVGFENGKTVVPYFRFPGETTYTEGTARPVITDDAFMWQRKTGKKFYAYVTSDDGAVQSNRVIIDAN